MQGVTAFVIAALAAAGSVGKLVQLRLNLGRRGAKERKRAAPQESHLSAAGGLVRPPAITKKRERSSEKIRNNSKEYVIECSRV